MNTCHTCRWFKDRDGNWGSCKSTPAYSRRAPMVVRVHGSFGCIFHESPPPGPQVGDTWVDSDGIHWKVSDIDIEFVWLERCQPGKRVFKDRLVRNYTKL